MSAVLSVEGLTVTARLGGVSAEALRDLSFDIRPGSILGVVGESGAGKSMLGRVIARQLPTGFDVTAGSVRFQDRDITAASRRDLAALLGREIAFIPQQPITSLNPVRTVGSQFDEHLHRLGISGGAGRRVRAIRQLEEVQLPDPPAILKRFPHQLSGGQCQRVLIAMAFSGEPSLIVADEPTTALDVITQATIMGLLAEMQRVHGTAVLFITHDLRLAAQVCDDIMVLYAGDMVEKGPARTVSARPAHPYTRSLQRANPSLSGPRRRLSNLPDHMPGLTAFAALPGCRFAPRCPVADGACSAAVPGLSTVGEGHVARASEGCLARAAAADPDGPVPDIADARPNAAPILKVDGLGKTFHASGGLLAPVGIGRGRAVEAVKEVSFDLGPGEFLGVVGESGSGKSTLARMLLGLETPSRGKVFIDGRDLTGPFANHVSARVEAIQMVFQDPQSALNPRRKVGQLVTQSMEARGRATSWPARLERARKLLSDTGLAPDTAGRYPSELSGGQRQRVNIARALCSAPRVLVADEIVSGLDVSVQAQILNLLLSLRQDSDIALVLISHDLSVVRYLCSKVIVMNKGDVVEAGRTEDVFANPQHPYTKSLVAAVPPDDPDREWAPLGGAV